VARWGTGRGEGQGRDGTNMISGTCVWTSPGDGRVRYIVEYYSIKFTRTTSVWHVIIELLQRSNKSRILPPSSNIRYPSNFMTYYMVKQMIHAALFDYHIWIDDIC
jgi:hypothetical protein